MKTAATAGEVTLPFFGQSARAQFVFSCDPSGRTYLSRQFASYPFHICRPTYVERDPPGMATLYLQSCSAGLLQHDDLHSSILVEEDAKLHFTTGAPTVVHSMEEGQAKQDVRIEAFPGSLAEYLPEPLILFPQARLRSSVNVTAHRGSSVIAGESFILHDYGGSDRGFDWLESELRVERPDGELLARDKFHLAGDVLKMGLPGVNGRYLAQGSLVVLDPGGLAEALVTAIRAALEPLSGIYSGASTLRGQSGAWVRLLASDGHSLRTAMLATWMAARETLTGIRPSVRRK
jgi:urease accessory protein